MICLIVLLAIISVNSSLATSNIKIGHAYSSWNYECDATEAIGGFQTKRVHEFAQGLDVMIVMFCRRLHLKHAPVVVGYYSLCFTFYIITLFSFALSWLTQVLIVIKQRNSCLV